MPTCWRSPGGSSALRRDHPVLRRRRFLTGAQADEIGWFTPSGVAMTDADWADPDARAVAMYLDGQDAPDHAPRRDLRWSTTTCSICVNAWWEPLDFAIPAQDAATGWIRLIDTADPIGRHDAGGDSRDR